jgi:hypothetical protein
MTRIVVAIAVFGALSGSPARALDITTCGQSVPDEDTGVLQADLDCSADPTEAAVTLGKSSTLDMNGHAIIARVVAVTCGSDARAPSCTIRGHGVAPSGVGDISGGAGIVGAPRRVTVSDVTVHDVAGGGIVVNQSLIATNVTVLRAGWTGISANKKLTATNVVASDNASFGIDSPRIRGTTVTANGNTFSGVSGRRCIITGLVANGNGLNPYSTGAGAGVQAVRATLLDSTLTGNAIDGVPVDVETFGRPRLAGTTCDHSRQHGDPSRSWGVCQLD